jgi:hypothetical protein
MFAICTNAATSVHSIHIMFARLGAVQGFGMMVSPSTSPDRMGRPALPAAYRRPLGSDRQDTRARVMGRPSRLSLDMSASKSENGDAHRLDPELAVSTRCRLFGLCVWFGQAVER